MRRSLFKEATDRFLYRLESEMDGTEQPTVCSVCIHALPPRGERDIWLCGATVAQDIIDGERYFVACHVINRGKCRKFERERPR